ncbi:MAG: hypothetical protein JJT90_10780 [Ectothiorhodospiraceae bacterium]|nr:hypothetical protein [Ectothiorhodospiraceae bacterium]
MTTREKNLRNPVWTLLEERWADLVESCHTYLAGYLSGRTASRHQVAASQEIISLNDHVAPVEIIDVVGALVLMRQWDPRRFLSDRAFIHQVARRVRALTDVNVGTTYDHRAGRLKRVYRDIPPRVALLVGQWLTEAFGGLGLWIHGMDRERERQQQERRSAIQQALKELR